MKNTKKPKTARERVVVVTIEFTDLFRKVDQYLKELEKLHAEGRIFVEKTDDAREAYNALLYVPTHFHFQPEAVPIISHLQQMVNYRAKIVTDQQLEYLCKAARHFRDFLKKTADEDRQSKASPAGRMTRTEFVHRVRNSRLVRANIPHVLKRRGAFLLTAQRT